MARFASYAALCVEAKEPGYWVKWVAGIVATVVAGLLVAAIAGVFESDPQNSSQTPTPKPPSARVRITQFSTAPARVGEYPAATFKVYNAGDDTADRCVIWWYPFDENVDELLGRGSAVSEEFAVEPAVSYTLTLRSSTPYEAGAVTSGAKLSCANSEIHVVTDFVLVL